MKYQIGDTVYMTHDALENYGVQWLNVPLTVASAANKYMPAQEFYASGKPEGYHPGYDDAIRGAGLYDLQANGKDLPMSLYDYELTKRPLNKAQGEA